MTLNKYLISCCVEALLLQDKVKGDMPAGHNGPYIDRETPVRNTAHWCVSFTKAFKLSGNPEFREAAIKCGKYLLSQEAVPMNSVYFCRMNPIKDFANGLVGQAWAIEALVSLFEMTGDSEYITFAIGIFKEHLYDTDYHAWIRRNVDGSLNGFDKTFNHELWFCAVGCLLASFDRDIEVQVLDFINHIDLHLEIYPDGCVKHKGYFLDLKIHERTKRFIKIAITPRSENKYLRMKSIGYHSFNMYAFAIINKIYPNLNFWKTGKFKKMIDYCLSNTFYNDINDNKYGLPYNVTGFEIPFCIETFFPDLDDLDIIVEKWINRQILFGKKADSFLLTENTKDPNTAMARIYEVCRFTNDYKIYL